MLEPQSIEQRKKQSKTDTKITNTFALINSSIHNSFRWDHFSISSKLSQQPNIADNCFIATFIKLTKQ